MMKRFRIARVAKCLNLRRLVAVVRIILLIFYLWKDANSCVPLLGDWLWIMAFLVDILLGDVVLHEVECHSHH